jgi:GT2 family glycosyltransferase
MKPTASIIILTYNNLDYTRQCLESIFSKTFEPAYEVIVVDNASKDETPNYLNSIEAEKANMKVILNENNLGFSAGNNIGAAAAEGDFLIFLNNDTIVTPGWLERLLSHLEDPSVGMVGPVTNSSGNETRIQVDYDDLSGLDSFSERYTTEHFGEAFEIQMLPLLCVALRTEVFKEIGPLDERFGIGMFEDDDYAMRLKQKGYRTICAEDVFIHHWGSASFSRLALKKYWTLFQENRLKFEEKWGISWNPHTFRRELLPLQLREMIDDARWRADQIYELEHEVSQVRQQLKNTQEELGLTQEHLVYTQGTLSRTEEQLQYVRDYLEDLYRSKAWAVISSIWKLRMRLAPNGSAQAKVLANAYRTVGKGINLFSKAKKWMLSQANVLQYLGMRFSFFVIKKLARKQVSVSSLGCAVQISPDWFLLSCLFITVQIM